MESNVDDADLAAAVMTTERSIPTNSPISSRAQPPQSGTSATKPQIQQPTPQHLPRRSGPSAILVSPRQKGNPILTHIRSVPWEYSDIPADYLLGATTCALFLSLKYHRLHPEYIYSRIRALAHKYLLRVLLVMVDIENHEASLNELAKTSLVNNLTLMLCWSATEAGRYLELYKSMEHATPTSIKGHAATSYAESLVEFATTPRSVNKTDAVALVSAFGSVRAAVNARPEEIGLIAGWGEKKIQRWTSTVREKFRVRKAARNRLGGESSRRNTGVDGNESGVAARLGIGPEQTPEVSRTEGGVAPAVQGPRDLAMWEPGEDEEEALIAVVTVGESLHSGKPLERGSEGAKQTDPTNTIGGDEEPSAGVMAALAKLREKTR
ncbi:MAG: ssDNA endonuclease and repair protein rad10 [Trichoglossum hirsutum]|jgi:DNA excision repair protein ERCC-1|nr:MAG: ssDNA endonuclease and repair protein rad10 [Trichoglossum hirsutum]